MKFLTYDEVDSTSDLAKNLLKEGEVPPLAVLAKKQVKGRGRSGKDWQSPKGNLYLSIALSKQHFKENPLQALPIAVGIAVCKFIDHKYSKRLTLKWPNDVLFAGKKLLGILVESTHSKDGWGTFVIGLGINIFEAPRVIGAASIALKDIVNIDESFEHETFAKELSDFVVEFLKSDWNISESYKYYGIEKNQPWLDSKGALYLLESVSDDGTLSMINEGKSKQIHTANHNLQWAYQDKKKLSSNSAIILLADLGNTTVKFSVFVDGKIVTYKRYAYDALDLFPTMILKQKYNLPDYWPVHFTSVNSEKTKIVKGFLEQNLFTAAEIPKRPVAVDVGIYPLNEIGIDRICILEALRNKFPNSNVLCVSMGTAVTVEFLSAEAVYTGGYIGAGVQMKLDALAEKTGLLPRLSFKDLFSLSMLEKPEGADTNAAMLQAVFYETVGLVQVSMQRFEEITKEKPILIFTGGDGKLFSKYFGVEYDDKLISRGVNSMILGGCQRKLD